MRFSGLIGNRTMDYLNYDNKAIYEEQKATLRVVFEHLDLSKVTFVGGVADYLNLRHEFRMPVHDLDIVYTNEADLQPLIDIVGVHRHKCKFYEFDEMEVLVTEHMINDKRVHIDFFKRNFIYGGVNVSPLLGTNVRHTSFESMKKFHNDHVAKLTSKALGMNYEWKRLYKHSKKASLYNLIEYRREKNIKELDYA